MITCRNKISHHLKDISSVSNYLLWESFVTIFTDRINPKLCWVWSIDDTPNIKWLAIYTENKTQSGIVTVSFDADYLPKYDQLLEQVKKFMELMA